MRLCKEDSFVFAEINKALKSDSIEAETKEKLKSVAALNTEEKALKSAIKTESALLEKKPKILLRVCLTSRLLNFLKKSGLDRLLKTLCSYPIVLYLNWSQNLKHLQKNTKLHLQRWKAKSKKRKISFCYDRRP